MWWPKKFHPVLRHLRTVIPKFSKSPQRHRSEKQKNIRMIYIFDNKESLEISEPKISITSFQFSPSLLEKWIELYNASNEFGFWDKNRFQSEFLNLLIFGTEILISNADMLIGSCAAFWLREYEPYPVLAFPVVLKDFQNLGLGTYIIKNTLRNCQNMGYPGIILHTQQHRQSAIHVYKKIGFVIESNV